MQISAETEFEQLSTHLGFLRFLTVAYSGKHISVSALFSLYMYLFIGQFLQVLRVDCVAPLYWYHVEYKIVLYCCI